MEHKDRRILSSSANKNYTVYWRKFKYPAEEPKEVDRKRCANHHVIPASNQSALLFSSIPPISVQYSAVTSIVACLPFRLSRGTQKRFTGCLAASLEIRPGACSSKGRQTFSKRSSDKPEGWKFYELSANVLKTV